MNQNDQMREALQRAFNLGQRYWQQADSDYQSEHTKADETYQKYKQLVDDTLQVLNHTPDTGDHIGDANKMVRLTEGEAKKAYRKGEQAAITRGIQSASHWLGLAEVMDAMTVKNGGAQ